MTDTAYQRMQDAPAAGVCPGFHWVGQTLAHCDNCGRPFWVHSHEKTHRRGSGGPFTPGRAYLQVITTELADAVRARWDAAGVRS